MYYDTAFDLDDLPDDDEPDGTVPESIAQAPAEPAAVNEEEEPGESATRLLPADAEVLEVEECFLMGRHGRYLDGKGSKPRMVEWCKARPWRFSFTWRSAAESHGYVTQAGRMLVAVDCSEQAMRLVSEPAAPHWSLWKLRPVADEQGWAFLVSPSNTYLATLDDELQTPYMSPNAEEWERWRRVRPKRLWGSDARPERAAAAAEEEAEEPADELQRLRSLPSEAARLTAGRAFGLAQRHVQRAALLLGAQPYLPHPKLESEEEQSKASEKPDPGRANFKVREEVLSMRMESPEPAVADIVATWEAWGCAFAGRLKFAAPPECCLEAKWLQKASAVPCHPAVVRLEGPGAVLDSIALALRSRA